MKIGFIGVGNMAKAIIKGLLNADAIAPENIVIHSAHQNNYTAFAEKYHLTPASSNIELTKMVDFVFIAVVPSIVSEILLEIKSSLNNQQTIVSMAAGLSLSDLAKDLSDSSPIIKIMPNVNVENLAGMTALTANENVTEENFDVIKNIFAKIGEVIELPEKDFSTFSAIAGSGPAFVYLFIDAMSRAGVKHGLTKDEATKIAAQTVLGSAKNLLASDQSPFNLIDQVSSPGGTTVNGVLKMEELGFYSATIAGIDATIDSNQEKN